MENASIPIEKKRSKKKSPSNEIAVDTPFSNISDNFNRLI